MITTDQDHRSTTLIAMLAATAMIANQVAGKAARDALFLTIFDVTRLPMMMLVSAVLSIAGVIAMSRLLGRLGPAVLVPRLYLASGLLSIAEWAAMGPWPAITTIALYLHISVLGTVLISGFWSVINERFDPYTAKGEIARLTASATLGGVLGGLAANIVGSSGGARSVLVMLGLMHLFCAFALLYVGRGQRQAQARQEPADTLPGSLLAPLKASPLVRRMALLILLVATNAALLDYLLKSTAAASLSDHELVGFFSYFYMIVGLGGFLLQTFVGGKVLRRFGLGGTLAILPAAVMLGGLFTLFLRHLVTVTLLRGSATLLTNTFFRSGFESLYTPIPAAHKRTGKILIDVGADRSGDMLGSLLVMALLWLPMATDRLLLTSSILLAALALFVVYLLHHGYVGQLADNLRDGTPAAPVPEPPPPGADSHTLIANTETGMSRQELLKQIAMRRRSAATAATEANAGTGPEPPAARAAPLPDDPDLAAIIDLRSGDRERIRRVLAVRSIDAVLLPHVLPLLAGREDLRELLQALRPTASHASGQLVDALLDRKQSPTLRRRLPLVLGGSDNQRAVDGLVECLPDHDRNVRFRCGQALRRIQQNYPYLDFHHPVLLRRVEQELERLRSHAGGVKPLGGAVAAAGASSPAERAREESLGHIFNLLGLVYEPRDFELCQAALAGDDPSLRGTALEYLESVLSPELRDALWPWLGAERRAPTGKARRPLHDLARDLVRAAPSVKQLKRQDGLGNTAREER